MRRRRRLAMTLALAAGAIGLVQIAGGLWIPAKAALAQVLLERAWRESLAGGTPARPWPWADTRAVARLTVAARSMIVLSGGSGAALAFGPSMVAGSAAPGGPGLAVIAGHRDTQFALLREVAPGQIIELETAAGDHLRYRVAGARITVIPGDPDCDSGLCDGGIGDCGSPQSGPGCGCDDCEALVCGIDPICCSVVWDEFCAGIAQSQCGP